MTDPEHVYVEYTEYVPQGFTGDKYEIITDQPEWFDRKSTSSGFMIYWGLKLKEVV